MPLPFETVREKLLRAGIAPRHVHRYVIELREHLADLTARELASGLDARQAADRARIIVGSDAELAQAMIDKGPARSLSARAPWAVFAVSPLLLCIAVLWIMGVSMMRLLLPVQGLTPAQMPQNYLTLIEVVGFVINYLLGMLLAAACITVALRQRQTSAWVWIGLAVISAFTGLMGFHMHVFAPAGGHPGGAVFSAVGIVYQQGRADLAATLGVAALRAAVLFAAVGALYRTLQTRLVAAM